LLGFCVAALQGARERLQVRIELDNACEKAGQSMVVSQVAMVIPVPSSLPFAGASLIEFADALTSSMMVLVENVLL
jgi:hypothetical protein